MTLQWTSLLGGLGLFLLGMHMLSEGLRLAAGSALERILATATDTRARALASGALTTAMVQSSSAVTVATIGFVNASLLSLGAAMWVLFGANLGTTATGWIVAFAGVKLDIGATALPMIALGAALKLGGRNKIAAWGQALAGFGLLFYGITLMQSGFADLSSEFRVPTGEGWSAIALQLLVGIVMTVLMQSSSASIAIALTAAQGGMIDLTGAAAVVIGANIGTTVTAVLACIGATSNAKRVASAHVIFNVITATVAFVFLPWLIPLIVVVRDFLGTGDSAALTLALFNTMVKLMGIVLVWPIANRMTVFLKGRFGGVEADAAKPMFLDKTTLPVPGVAARALSCELQRMLGMAREYVLLSLTPQGQVGSISQRSRLDLQRLLRASETFVDEMNRQAMDAETGEKLAQLLRVRRYLENVVDNAGDAMALPHDLLEHSVVSDSHQQYADSLQTLLQSVVIDPEDPSKHLGEQSELDTGFEDAYEALKQALLAAGATGQWPVESMERALQRISAQRRAVQQLMKAQRWLVRAMGQVG